MRDGPGEQRAGHPAVGERPQHEGAADLPDPPGPGTRPRHVADLHDVDRPDRGVAGALLARAVEHARERRYNRLLLAPTDVSAAFYRRAGFGPAGESLLVLDPAAVAD